MSEPMSKDHLERIRCACLEGYISWPSEGPILIAEVRRSHSEIERLEKALDGSESLRHTIMTAALDAKRTFLKRIAELEKINENLAAAYHQLQENIANYHEHRKWEDWK